MATKWPKDDQASRNAFYGDPGRGEIAPQMVAVTPPFAMYYDGKRVKAIQFHRKCAPALAAALKEIWDYCEHDQAKVDASGASKYFGAYNHRMVRGSKTKWSNHAYAAAIDLNALQNALGVKGNMPQFITDAFVRQGAMWGGWYKNRPDWMHYEFVDNGGRKPKSPPPVWPRAAGPVVHPETNAPADEFEDHPTPPAAAPSSAPPNVQPVNPAVNGDPVLLDVQTRLKARRYPPGVLDGKWGSGTSGALSGFMNDRGLRLHLPTKLGEFHEIADEVRAELFEAETEVQLDGSVGWFRPVSQARANADASIVKELAPETVPVKRNFFSALGASILAFLGTLWETVSGYVSQAWDFFTDHKDVVDDHPGIVSTAWGYFTSIPSTVWLFAGGCGLAFIAYNSWRAIKTSTQAVQNGERQ